MQKILKYPKKFLREFDVSPFDSDNSLRLLIYIVWGFSALMFLGNDYSNAADKFSYPDNSGQTISCTVLKKVITLDIYVEHFTFIKTSQFVIISPLNYELPSTEFVTPLCARAPPHMIFA